MKKTFASTAIHQIAENISKRSLVIIFSDMMDHAENTEDMFSAMQHLKHNKHEVILFHVVDKKHEIDFQFENRPYLFVDVETGEKVKVHTNEVKDNYIQSMAKYRQELILRCGQYRIDFVEADINEGFRQILLPYLIKRERLH
jgi:predicted RNA-binding protein associated with RNAse of E/G family